MVYKSHVLLSPIWSRYVDGLKYIWFRSTSARKWKRHEFDRNTLYRSILILHFNNLHTLEWFHLDYFYIRYSFMIFSTAIIILSAVDIPGHPGTASIIHYIDWWECQINDAIFVFAIANAYHLHRPPLSLMWALCGVRFISGCKWWYDTSRIQHEI